MEKSFTNADGLKDAVKMLDQFQASLSSNREYTYTSPSNKGYTTYTTESYPHTAKDKPQDVCSCVDMCKCLCGWQKCKVCGKHESEKECFMKTSLRD